MRGKGVPGPGTYKMRSTLKHRGTTLLGKVPTDCNLNVIIITIF